MHFSTVAPGDLRRGLQLILAVLFALIASGCAQPAPGPQADAEPDRPFTFPADWLGDWQGTLNIWRPGADTAMQVPMKLHVQPIAGSDRWTWTIVYGEGEKRAPREYELVALDPEKGLYEVDEKNGILLKGYVIYNAFYGLFSVQGSLILDKYERKGDALEFEIISGQLEQGRASGDTVLAGNDTIPPVMDYPVRVMQRALLYRIP